MKLFNKEVIAELEVDLFNRDYNIVVLDNEKQNMYDIHVLTDRYAQDELNTLFLQEPKDAVSVDEFDRLYLTMIVTEFALWDNLYGYNGKRYSFSLKIEDEDNLDTIFN